MDLTEGTAVDTSAVGNRDVIADYPCVRVHVLTAFLTREQ
jgi:hypothetical protein